MVFQIDPPRPYTAANSTAQQTHHPDNHNRIANAVDEIVDFVNPGWHPVASGALLGDSSFLVAIPDGCRMLNVHAQGYVAGGSGTEHVFCRVNNDSTNGLHRRTLTRWNVDGTVDGFVANDSNLWYAGYWSGRPGNSLVSRFYATHTYGNVTMSSTSFRDTSFASTPLMQVSAGALTDDIDPTSILFFPSSGRELWGSYWVEGYTI